VHEPDPSPDSRIRACHVDLGPSGLLLMNIHGDSRYRNVVERTAVTCSRHRSMFGFVNQLIFVQLPDNGGK
jgi:hypothetical protein